MTANVLSIKQIIESNLPTLVYANDGTIDPIITDCCIEMETCFRVRWYLDEQNLWVEDWARVGDEALYNPIQKSIIADFASWRYLLKKMIEGTTELSTSLKEQTGGRFIKKAKAGSAEAEFEQRDIRNNPGIIKIADLMNQLKSNLMRKARNLGCIIDVNADNVYKIELETSSMELPMFVLRENCGCNGLIDGYRQN